MRLDDGWKMDGWVNGDGDFAPMVLWGADMGGGGWAVNGRKGGGCMKPLKG